MSPFIAFSLGFAAASVIGFIVSAYVYRRGLVNGFGYCLEPDRPKFAKAGKWLRDEMARKWPGFRRLR